MYLHSSCVIIDLPFLVFFHFPVINNIDMAVVRVCDVETILALFYE
jgi:hypothetical protein